MARSLVWMHKLAKCTIVAAGLVVFITYSAKANYVSKDVIEFLSKRAIVDYSETIVDWQSYDKSKFIALSNFLQVGMNSSFINSPLNPHDHSISINFSDIKRDDMIELLRRCPLMGRNCIAIVSGNVEVDRNLTTNRKIKAVHVQYCVISGDGVCRMDYGAVAK